jgi:WD40 repeat protein
MWKSRLKAFTVVLKTSALVLALGALLPNVLAADGPAPAPAVHAALKGHMETVYAIGFTPDGKQVVTGSFDHTVKLWDVATGKEVHTFGGPAGHQNLVLSLAISPDGQTLASGGADNVVKLWDIPSTGPLRQFVQSSDATGLALSPDDTRLAGAGKDGSITLWSTADGKQVFHLRDGHRGPVTGIAFSSNGQLLASSGGKAVCLWDPLKGHLLGTLQGHMAPVTALALHPGNTLAFSADEAGTLRFWRLPLTARQVLPAYAATVNMAALSADGSQVLRAGADRTVKLWDLETGNAVKTFGPLDEPVSAVALSRDSQQAAAAAGKTVKVWNLADGKELLSLVHPDTVLSVAFNDDRSRIITGSADRQTRVWDAGTGTLVEAFTEAGPVRSVAAHPTQAAVISMTDGKTAVVDTLSAVRVIAASKSPVRSLAVTANGSHVLTASDDMTLKLWNTTTGANDRVLAGSDHYIRAVAVSKNNALVAVGGVDTLVRLYDLAEAKLVGTFRVPADVHGLSFSPDNKVLAAACADKSVQVWNVVYTPGQPVPAEFGKPLQPFHHDGPATGVVFASDNRTLYSSGSSPSVRVWRLTTDGPTQSFAHPNLVDAVAFNPAGTQLATGCHNGSVLIWDLAKKQQLRAINAHPVKPPSQDPNPVYCVAWSADGKQIISGSRDHSLKLWDAATGNLIREFKAYQEKPLALPLLGASMVGFQASPFGQGPFHAPAALFPGRVREFERGHRDSVFCVAFSPDGRTLVSGSSDHTIKVWNLADGSILRELANPHVKPSAGDAGPEAHPGWVYGLRYTPDGKYLVSVGNAPLFKGYLAIWSAADGKLTQAEELPLGPINSVAVSPDGKLLGLACSPPGRQFQQVDSYLLRMPDLQIKTP